MKNRTNQVWPIKIQELSVRGMTFRCRLSGLENTGEAIIFLHGFPETSHLWEGILQYFASEGYRCLAPDQRGYSPGARPSEINAYKIEEIAADVIALADSLGWQRFHLVGHDWGAGCGWTIVHLFPERVQSWSALSIPHLKAFETAKKKDPDQKKRSGYMTFFQIPLVPEMLFGLIVSGKRPSLWKDSSPEEIADYLTVFGKFDGRRATINWYRANRFFPINYGDVFLPSILIWGNQDPVVGRVGVNLTQQYMKGDYSLIELEAGHALVQEQFEPVKQALFEHIRQNPIAA